CHGTGYDTAAAMGPACYECHEGLDAPHGFVYTASGHSTKSLGKRGAYEKFDGSGSNPALTWTATQAFTITTNKAAAALTVAPGTSFTAGQTGVVNSDWVFPTKSVFWAEGAVGNATTAMEGLTKDSIITCEDCHTGLAPAGPHGADPTNWGIDPNFPGDYSMAGLTKKVTSGDKIGGNTGVYSPSGIFVASNLTSASTIGKWATSADWKDGTTGANAVICAKCHGLMTVMPADSSIPATTNAAVWGTTPNTSGRLWAVAVGANTAHNSHHQDSTDGSPQCVSCHVAVPHGWNQPRLLIDIEGGEYEGTVYQSENAVEAMGTLAALNNHVLVPTNGTIAYDSGSGAALTPGVAGTSIDVSRAGTVLWDESQCDACGDHYGNKPNVLTATGVSTTIPVGVGVNSGAGVPVRIDR
ncbi:MAG: hypothetical protein WCI74_11650, partial [Actinomycetes bacterium]